MKKPLLYIFIFFSLLTFNQCEDDDTKFVAHKMVTDTVDLTEKNVGIISPVNNLSPNRDSLILFKGKVTPFSEKDTGQLVARWVSDYDQVLHATPLDKQGETEFSMKWNELSKNVHQIKLEIVDLKDSIIYDSIYLPNVIHLLKLQVEQKNIRVKWNIAESNDFDSYSLYRGKVYRNDLNYNAAPIFTSSNVNDTSFLDTTGYWGENYYYQVFLNRNVDTFKTVGSNLRNIVTGDLIELDYPLFKLIKDPTRNFVYGIVNLSNFSFNSPGNYGVVFINTATKVIEKKILSGVRFSDLELHPNGNLLYLSSRSEIIHVIDLRTQNLISTFQLSKSAHKIEIGNNDRLYYHETPPTSGGTKLGLYDLANQVNLPYADSIVDAFKRFRHGDMELSNTNHIFHGGSNSTNSGLSKVNPANDRFIWLGRRDSYQLMRSLLIINNNNIYWNHIKLDTNLNIIGRFQYNGSDKDIYDVSPDGSLGLSQLFLYRTQNQTIHSKVPVNYESGSFLSNNELLLYRNDSRGNSCQIVFYDF